MARRSTARKVPVALNRLHGNPSRRKIAADTPEGVGVLWAPPSYFNDDQRAQWHHAIEHAPIGLITETDRNCLVAWCVAAVIHQQAVVKVSELGLLVKTKDGNLIQNPYLPIINRQATLMLRAGAEMGFTPAARASIGAQMGAGVLAPVTPSFGAGRSASLAEFIDSNPDVQPPPTRRATRH